jgi:protein TonB
MFELTAGTVDRPFRDKHAAATAFSIVSHAAALGTVAFVLMFAINEQMPEVPTMMAFVAEAPAPPPPPPPPPPTAPRTPRAAQAAKQPAPTPGPIFVVPAEIPVGIQPETGIGLRDEGGVVGGVEGGIPGGMLGGILGGMVAEAPPPPPPPVRPMRVGGDIKAPALVHRVEPDYPGVAVSAKVTGMVILEATVDETGAVTDVTVLRSISLLDGAAIKAVKQWRYEPLLLNGKPAPFILTVVLTFSLR